MVDLGSLKLFLGMQIDRNQGERTMFVRQERYAIFFFFFYFIHTAWKPKAWGINEEIPRDRTQPLSPANKEILHTVAFQLQTSFLRGTSIKEITLTAIDMKVIIG